MLPFLSSMCSDLIAMWRISLFLWLFLWASPILAQDDYYYSDPDKDQAQVKTLFSRKANVGGFGTFDMKLAKVLDQTSFWVGMSGGVTLDHKLIIGLGGYGLAGKIKYQSTETGQFLDLTGGYGGLLLGFNVAHQEVVHVTFPVLIGAGGLDVTNNATFSPDSNPDIIIPPNGFRVDASNFFILEPGILMELNLTTWFRFGLGGQYRFVQGIDLEGITDQDLRSWVATCSLKFGKF